MAGGLTVAPLSVFAQEGGPPGAPPPPPVTVVTVQPEDVTLTAMLPGRALPSAEAELRPQVSGIITERLFDEGRAVKKDQPLYRIDPRSYQAAVAQAEAVLSQATATADAARRDAERVGTLRDRRVASEQTQDTAIATRDAAEAAVDAARAGLDGARLDLERTTITAPLDGVIGLALASQGQLVTASQTSPLAVIRRIDPIQVDVTQSAAEIVRWQRQGGAASLPAGADQTVRLHLADGTVYDHTGSLTGAEPHVDETTGVVTLRMEFENPDRLLLPGMYVLAEIPQAKLSGVVLAPQEGVTRDRRGRPIAYVIGADNKVEERQLDIVQDRGNSWVVREGLAVGDRLVVAGFQSIQPGIVVSPEERGAAPPEGGAPGQPGAGAGGGAAAGSAATGDAATGAEPANAGADTPARREGATGAAAEPSTGVAGPTGKAAADQAKPETTTAPAAEPANTDTSAPTDTAAPETDSPAEKPATTAAPGAEPNAAPADTPAADAAAPDAKPAPDAGPPATPTESQAGGN
ncbi:efflux RND transporter periplasmic adaptor subunit [Paracoccus suum]|uniref:Efflux RND transporter periplasmic adaptor subunit n=2 Tax=Paracoccus suum TaxID=2259340 RepID=A0A344PNL7_9RHOB|nr:efflux RND transporter periplasmic adaptor subunit [Paracoccus suum]